MFFAATRVLEYVKRTGSPGLLWKKLKFTQTRRANAKKRLRRVWQNEAVLKACATPPEGVIPPPETMKDRLKWMRLRKKDTL